MIYTSQDYEEAILNLQCGMKQLEPDGDNCAVCGDTGHQAWECHHNPLVKADRANPKWRCFHCDETFDNAKDAQDHFGNIPAATARCILKKCLCLQCPCNPTECSGKAEA